MTTYVALLRAVNVGGTGKLPMKDLTGLCVKLELGNVRTYIQSGNVVFESALPESKVRAALEESLAKKMGKKVDVMVRSAAEMRGVLEANPFPDALPAKVAVMFLAEAYASSLLKDVVAPGGEQVRPGKREVYIYFPNGMGRSKLKLPSSLGPATARNINTVAKLVAMCG